MNATRTFVSTRHGMNVAETARNWPMAAVAFLAVLLFCSAALATPITLTDSDRSLFRTQQISNGYLVSHMYAIKNRNKIVIDDLKNASSYSVSIDLGASAAWVAGAAVIADGKLALVGSYQRNAGNPQLFPFLAFADFSGRISKVVELGSFVPRAMCTTQDGTSWVLGQDFAREGDFFDKSNDVTKVSASADYGLLRAYGPDGNLLRSSLMRSSIHSRAAWFLDLTGDHTSGLACGPQSVVAFIGSPGNFALLDKAVLTEIDQSDYSVQQWYVGGGPAAYLSGLSVPALHVVRASFHVPAASSTEYALQLGQNGVGRWSQLGTAVPDVHGTSLPKFKLVGDLDGQVATIGDRGVPDATASIATSAPDLHTITTHPAAAVTDEMIANLVPEQAPAAAPATASPTGPYVKRHVGRAIRGLHWASLYAPLNLHYALNSTYNSCPNSACEQAIFQLKNTINNFNTRNSTKHTQAFDEGIEVQIQTELANLSASLVGYGASAVAADAGSDVQPPAVPDGVEAGITETPPEKLLATPMLSEGECEALCGAGFGGLAAICTVTNKARVTIVACIAAETILAMVCITQCAPDTQCPLVASVILPRVPIGAGRSGSTHVTYMNSQHESRSSS